MLFDSFAFICFFLPGVLGMASLLKHQALLAWIVCCSLLFYSFQGRVWFIVPLLFTMTLDFCLAQILSRLTSRRKRRLILWLSLTCNLGLLAYFKYAHVFLRLSESLSRHWGVACPHWVAVFSIAFPAGISFYTFQTIAYMVDVYRGRAAPERNFFAFAGFVTFFPISLRAR